MLERNDIEPQPDGTLVLSRSLSASGRNSCRVNGCPVTVSVLREIGSGLINIHGQHDGQALLMPERHCGFIDSLAENSALRAEYKAVFTQLVAVKRKLDSLYDSRDEKEANRSFLDFQINELTAADVHIGEREALNKEKELYNVQMTSSEKYMKNLTDVKHNIQNQLLCIENLIDGQRYDDCLLYTSPSPRDA